MNVLLFVNLSEVFAQRNLDHGGDCEFGDFTAISLCPTFEPPGLLSLHWRARWDEPASTRQSCSCDNPATKTINNNLQWKPFWGTGHMDDYLTIRDVHFFGATDFFRKKISWSLVNFPNVCMFCKILTSLNGALLSNAFSVTADWLTSTACIPFRDNASITLWCPEQKDKISV